MLQSGELTPIRAKHAVEVIGRNARLQAQLIEDILDVSRIITGKLEIERVPVSVPQLLEAIVSGAGPAAEAKRIKLRQQIASDLPPVEGDPKRLQQVFNNVLSNALKFTPEGGSVVLRCRADSTAVTIEIEDSGIGIAPEFLPFVFERFRQADSRSTRAHGGLGLGLAITRHLVEQHGGLICANSGGPGKGTTVSIQLPAGAIPVWPAESERGTSEDSVRLDDIAILVVDDDPDSREMIGALLESRGARVVHSESATSAIQMLRHALVHLIVADIAMPEIDGYELMRRIRATGNRVPAVAVTAFARSDDRRTALESGYTAYLAKPIDGKQLAKTIRELVAQVPS
jgi:CheY-like chemotaxis protein